MTRRFHYVASLAFDPAHDDSARRAWLGQLRERMQFMVDVEEVLSEDEAIQLPDSDGVCLIEFWPDQPADIRRARLLHLADQIEAVRLHRPTLPDELPPIRYRMAP